MLHMKIKQNMDQKHNANPIQVLEENIGVNGHDLISNNGFLYIAAKHEQQQK